MSRSFILTASIALALLAPQAHAQRDGSVRASSAARAPEVSTSARVAVPGGEVQFEVFTDGTVTVVERGMDGASHLDALAELARAQGISLCPGQIYGVLTNSVAPPELMRGCLQQADVLIKQTQALRAAAKVFRIFDDFRDRPLLCNGAGNDSDQFREIECTAEQLDLYNDNYFDSDSTFWCANTLRTASDRSMSVLLGSEGEAASTRVLSCDGNTRFRFYKRDSTGDSWGLYRDYVLLANEYLSFYTYDNDAWGDSDFRFKLDSSGSGRHRSTGYFTDD